MDNNIESLKNACDKLRLRTKQLDAWMPDGASKPAKRLMNMVIRHSEEVSGCVEKLINLPKNEGCRCVELEEMLELIPKKLSLGEV